MADARRLPLATGSCAAVVAAFSYNHVPDPELALADAARVVVPGGAVLASAYAADDTHPVKAAVERAAAEVGWTAEPWIDEMKADSVPRPRHRRRRRAVRADAPASTPTSEQVDVAVPRARRPPTSSPGASAWPRSPRSSPRSPRPRVEQLERARPRAPGPRPRALVRRMIVLTART